MSCRTVIESWPSREIRALKCLRDLQDSSRSTIRLESKSLRGATWPRVVDVGDLQRGSEGDFRSASGELIYDLVL